MSPIYLNPQTASSPIPFLELKGDQQHNYQVFGHVHDHDLATSSNNSCLSYNNSLNSHGSQEMLSFDYSRQGHSKVEKLVVSHEKPASDLGQPYSSWLQSTVGDNSGCSYDYSFHLQGVEKIETDDVKYDDDDHHQNKFSKKWKPSKVRIMQKMMTSSNKNSGNSSKQQLDHLPKQQRQNNDGIRVCSDCHTTTTPLWRSGPQGPKSLCNACGIRQRKARRAAMAAAAAAGFDNDGAIATPPLSSPRVEARKSANKAQEMKSERGLLDQDKTHTLPIKKRSKIIDANNNNNQNNNNNYYIQNPQNYNNNHSKELCYEDIELSSNKDYLKPNPKRSFPRDEEEGAILLMALSCGLACSS